MKENSRGFTHHHFSWKSGGGFTLIETLIYIALFGLVLSGIVVSSYPLFTNTEQGTTGIVYEGEAAFILHKISWALSSAVKGTVSVSAGTLSVTHADAGPLTFSHGGETLSFNGTALNATRAPITNFSAVYNSLDQFIELEFDAGERHIGPVRYYLHF